MSDRETLHPYDAGQPEVVSIDAFARRQMHFSDGASGAITNWIDAAREVHEHPVDDTVAVVACHPGRLKHPWYAVALGADERRA